MLDISDLTYYYPQSSRPAIDGIKLHLEKGEMLLLAGCSGCGKSTLLKAVCGILQRGRLSGRISLNGTDVMNMSVEQIGMRVGAVYQTPDDQLFAMTVYDEVAFALENRRLPADIVRAKVAEALQITGLGGLESAGIHTLSGGQRQRLALAAVLAAEPELLLLDEPVSQLNSQGAQSFLALLNRLSSQRQLTVLVIEHRVSELAGYFKRLAVMEQGRLVYDGVPEEAWDCSGDERFRGLREPPNVQLCRLLHLPHRFDDMAKLIEVLTKCRLRECPAIQQQQKKKKVLLHAENVSYCYEGAAENSLQALSFELCSGEIIALMGCNGAGKSTLLDLLAGLSRLQQGVIELDGCELSVSKATVAYLRQEADLMLLADTVREEICWNNSLTLECQEKFLADMQLTDKADAFPLALSKGQRLRVVLAAALAREPQLLLLDEPTTGQDHVCLQSISRLLAEYAAGGGCVFFCTHDVELAAEIADKAIIMKAGEIIANGKTADVLSCRDLLAAGGLEPPGMLAVAEALGLKDCITAQEVSRYVDASAVGGR